MGYGPPDGLHLTEVATPTPADDEVLIKVQAVSVNRSDWEHLTGKPLYARFHGLRKPKRGSRILGSDIAGHVERAGRNHLCWPNTSSLHAMRASVDRHGENLRHSPGCRISREPPIVEVMYE